jgi:hypothetical protein
MANAKTVMQASEPANHHSASDALAIQGIRERGAASFQMLR